jgi:hypothetical protein
MTMSSAVLKLSLHKLVDKISDESVLEAYLLLLAGEVERESEKDFWVDLDDETKKSIEDGLADIENGDTVDAIEYMKSTYGV